MTIKEILGSLRKRRIILPGMTWPPRSCWEPESSNGPGQSPSERAVTLARLKHPATTNPRRWAVVRRTVLDRDGWRCVKCGKAGRLEVDHIVPVQHSADAWWPPDVEGLQALVPWLAISPSHGPTLPGLIPNGTSGGDTKSAALPICLICHPPKFGHVGDLSSAGCTGLKTGNHTHGSIGHNVSIMDSQTK